MNDLALGLIGAVGVLVGLLGVLVPVVPGLLLVWLATAGTLLVGSRSPLVWGVVVVLSVLAIIGSVASVVLPARRTHADGAPPRTLGSALVGAIIGFFVVPVVGLVIGAAVGLLLAERGRLGEWDPAWTSTRRLVGAYGVGVLVEFGAGMTMAGLWLVALVLG